MSRFLFISFFLLAVTFFSCETDSSNNSVKLSPEVFKDSINKADVQIIDVRKLKEFREYHIQNASHINYFSETFADSINLLDINKSVFIYCRSGKRSSKSASVFEASGFKKVYELEGGILNWKKEGLQTVTK